MSAAEAQSEPTMEEILASIRRIISEDDASKPAEPEASEDTNFDDVLELQEQIDEPVLDVQEDTFVDSDFDFDALDIGEEIQEEPEVVFQEPEEIVAIDRDSDPIFEFESEPEFEDLAPPPIFTPPPQAAAQPQSYQPRVVPPHLEETIGLIGVDAANAASEAFAKLGPAMPGHFAAGPSVEELVAYLLKPMLKEWLDKNLPRIVEERVEAELARIARRGF